MFTSVIQTIYSTYSWSIRKFSLILYSLFNKKYLDSKQVEDFIKDIKIKTELIEADNLNHFLESQPLMIDLFTKLQQPQDFQENLKNVILFRINSRLGFSYDYGGRDSIFHALHQAHEIESITKGNGDLVLLMWLIYVHVPVNEHEELLKDLVKNHSGSSRIEMIEKIYLLQEEGKLSINSRERLNCIIKLSPFLEKQYSHNKGFAIMKMVNSGSIVENIEERVKELTGINIAYDQNNKSSPLDSLKNISICAVIENYGLLSRKL